ncbi:unnamed protein product [Strongylus vulgaris]|uniref:Uncharacterized protein n=1 Tax=Strongylus vulgaris TaxID=40348 RepID=A0A3P7LJW2_STRVU|nr:unnamed protein product [Strongylus vulgaris]
MSPKYKALELCVRIAANFLFDPMSRRRASDFAHNFFRSIIHRFQKHETKRSLSTGDLADNYMLMDFSEPTTSMLPSHFDDSDRVPMVFSESLHPRLMSQHDYSAQKLVRRGISTADYNRSQVWFYQGMNSKKAERLLQSFGFEEGLVEQC